MKKSLIKNICISLACLLGIGGMTGMALSSNKEAVQVNAASEAVLATETLSFFSTVTSSGTVESYGTWTDVLGNLTTEGYVYHSSGNGEWNLTLTKSTDKTIVKVKFEATIGQCNASGSNGSTIRFNNNSFSYGENSGSSTFNLSHTDTSYCVNNQNTPVNLYVQAGNYKTPDQREGMSTRFTSLTITIYYQASQVVTISSGTGVSSVYLSNDENATSGSDSGTEFDKDSTVYGFAVLKKGYKAKNTWTLVSGTGDTEGAKYRAVSQTVGSSPINFGSMNADPKHYTATFNPAPGVGGTTELDVIYDAVPGTLSSLPSRGSSGGHSYSFGGYYTQAPTDNPDGTQTPNGKRYFNNLGQGVDTWTETVNTSLYAYWTVDMTVSASGYSGIYDGEPHGITVTPSYPEGATVYYGTSSSTCDDPDVDNFKYTEVSAHIVYFEVRKDGYTTYKDSLSVYINKAPSVVDPKPTAITGLEYTSNNQALVNEGTVDYGNMLYAVNTTGELPDDGDFTTSIPTGNLVGTYYVFYKSTGDDNHNPYPKSLDNVVEVNIVEVDKTMIKALNQTVIDYLDTIDDNPEYATIVATLEAVRNEVYDDAIAEPNVTSTVVATNVTKLQDALSEAKVAVTEALIEAIGTVSYPGSKAAVTAAESSFESLTEEEKAAVDSSLVDVLNKDATDYHNADAVASLISAIPTPSDNKEYYDAVQAAKEAYEALATSNPDAYALLNNATNVDYEKVLDDNIKAKEVIIHIQDIGALTYNGGTNDSLAGIKTAEEAYNALSNDQKALVDLANHNTLVSDRASYDKVAESVGLVNSIGEVTHGGDNDSLKAINEAREYYDSLSEKEKALVGAYNNTYKTLDNAEHVYDAMVEIDAIGEVSFDTNSEEAINKAREVYDSLTEEQKAQIGAHYLQLLTNSETKYEELKKSADIWVIILLIIASLTLIGGIWFLIFIIKRRKDEDDENDDGNTPKGKKEPVNMMSVGGLMPLIIYASHYLDTPYIVLYIISGLAVLVWLTALVVYFMKKKQVGPFKKKEVVVNTQPGSNDDEEVVTVTDEKGNIFQIRFIKSFTAKIIQANEDSKKYYEELKNYVLSYKGTTSRVSWNYDSINAGRNPVVKFGVRGKTLCVYYPLDADKYLDTKYKVEKVESKRFEAVPCMYRIKNDRRLGYAKDLIDEVIKSLGLEKGEEQHEKYVLPYEENKPLVMRGLIKELKVQVNKPIEEVLETKVDEEGDEIVTTQDNKGNKFEIRYLKSFTAKLSQTTDEMKEYYNELKNYVLSYKGVSSRVSWQHDLISINNKPVLRFAFKRKNLCVYYALDPSKIGQKYKVEHSEYKKYENVPCLYRIENNRRKEYAKELIDRLMRKYKLEKGKEFSDEYRIPFEETKVLLAKGLIKEVKAKIN